MNESRTEERRRLLQAALRHVPFDGWSWAAMRRAARESGMPEGSERRLFPGGPAALIRFFSSEMDRQMLAALEEYDLPAMKIRERIATAVRLRIDLMAPEREAVRRAVAFQALPGRAPGALRGLSCTVDAIWRGIGDRSTDFSYYSKRALLAPVYASTLLVWLDDKSEGSSASWAFLERRIADVLRIQKFRSPFDRVASRLPSPWRGLGRLRYGFAREER